MSKWGELKASLQGETAGDRYNGAQSEVQIQREAGEAKSKMNCGVTRQMRTFS